MKKIIYIFIFLSVIFLLYIFLVSMRNETTVVQEPVVATTTVITNEPATTTKNIIDRNQKIEYFYPDNFYINEKIASYVNPVDWPPTIVVSTSTSKILTCAKNSKSVTINQNKYCLEILAEGAAGSTYTTYIYNRILETKNIKLSFTVRTPQCMNYDEPKQSECKTEIQNFDINSMADKIFASIKFLE